MSDNPYIVIFEHTKITGGFYKIRRRTDYTNQAQFQSIYKAIPETTIIAEGITEDQAYRLLCSVPAVCQYLAAVEKLFEVPDAEVTLFRLQWVMENANMAAAHGIEQRFNLGILNEIDADFMAHLMDLIQIKTLKGRYMRYIIGKYLADWDYMPQLHFESLLEE
ncbi:MAG: hypothetical protein UW41_C0012G0030 [Candidatus Collierbacteria bacterium GW2011_GWC2_44_18]|uniref:Uncharacterized protein n=1 Tax=Candidatus Collierbacteria bacterium GW2011_GWC2_44_18 TaxID=1618392 RepID=A0A0G1JZ10_9BACT|nr:MAG: hypothetical protein UW41_C0012G0030 [Candidatus Collierbacteria bacterium GW2011_GWC2_44_18]